MKTKAGWDESRLDLTHYLQIGDHVDEEIYNYCLEVLPPACWKRLLLQVGEPHSHVNGRPTYVTIVGSEGNRRYAGCCWRGQCEEPKAA